MTPEHILEKLTPERVLVDLLSQSCQIFLTFIVAAATVRAIGPGRPRLTQAIWLLVLLKCLIPPLIPGPLPSLGPLAASWFTTAPQEIVDLHPGDSLKAATPLLTTVSPEVALGFNWDNSQLTPMLPPDQSSLHGPQPSADTLLQRAELLIHETIGTNVALTFIATFIVGALLHLFWMFRKFRASLREIYDHTNTQLSTQLQARVDQLAVLLRLQSIPNVIVSDTAYGPAVMGLRRKTIALPSCLVDVNQINSLDPIIAHELLHIRRCDLLIGFLQCFARALWWFNPLVRFISDRLTIAVEVACDHDVIAELGCTRATYARSLLAVIESKHRLQSIPVLPGMKPVEITSLRMERIMKLRPLNETWGSRLGLRILFVVLAGIVLPGSCMNSLAQPEDAIGPPTSSLPNRTPIASTPQVTTAESKSLRTFDVSEVVEKLTHQYQCSKSEATVVLMDHIHQLMQPHRVDQQHDKEQPYVLVDQHKLVIRAKDQEHQLLQSILQELKQFGITEYVVSVLVLSGAPDDINRIAAKPVVAEDSPEGVLLKELITQSDAKVPPGCEILSRPRIRSNSGTPANIEIGNYSASLAAEIKDGALVLQPVLAGIQILIVPSARSENSTNLHFAATITSVVGESTSTDSPSVKTSASSQVQTPTTSQVRKSHIETSLDLKEQEIAVVGQMVDPGSSDEALRSVVFLLNVERVPANEMHTGNKADRTDSDQPVYTTRAYAIADLLTPPQGKDASENALKDYSFNVDFTALIELIRSSTGTPESWSDSDAQSGGGQIVAYKDNLSLVIRQTPDVHDQIAKLLESLRADEKVVNVKCTLLTIPAEASTLTSWMDRTLHFQTPENGAPWTQLSIVQAARLQSLIKDSETKVLLAPQITVYDRQTASIKTNGPGQSVHTHDSDDSGKGSEAAEPTGREHFELELTIRPTIRPSGVIQLQYQTSDSRNNHDKPMQIAYTLNSQQIAIDLTSPQTASRQILLIEATQTPSEVPVTP
ncbi:MAG: hypothetical protein JNL58_31255 [Planctomyces sp.]|nr:hypothetical protein [Planctomyces sp.]